jgi:hypothetical protein
VKNEDVKMTKIRLGMLTVMLMLAAGCQQGPPKISQGQALLPGDEDSAGFLDRMSSQRTVTQNDAMRGVLLLIDNDKDDSADFASRVQSLRKRDIVPNNWNFQADKPLTKGQLAYMIYQACHVRGGLTLLLTGPSQRYCLRELQYQRVMSNGTMFDQVTGMEYVGVIQRALSYVENDGQVPENKATLTGADE